MSILIVLDERLDVNITLKDLTHFQSSAAHLGNIGIRLLNVGPRSIPDTHSQTRCACDQVSNATSKITTNDRGARSRELR